MAPENLLRAKMAGGKSHAKKSNVQILTNQGRRAKRVDAKVTPGVIFDPKARKEYLTGFELRKKERKAKAEEKIKNTLKNARTERRKQKRDGISTVVKSFVAEMQAEQLPKAEEHTTVIESDENVTKRTTVIIQEL